MRIITIPIFIPSCQVQDTNHQRRKSNRKESEKRINYAKSDFTFQVTPETFAPTYTLPIAEGKRIPQDYYSKLHPTIQSEGVAGRMKRIDFLNKKGLVPVQKAEMIRHRSTLVLRTALRHPPLSV